MINDQIIHAIIMLLPGGVRRAFVTLLRADFPGSDAPGVYLNAADPSGYAALKTYRLACLSSAESGAAYRARLRNYAAWIVAQTSKISPAAPDSYTVELAHDHSSFGSVVRMPILMLPTEWYEALRLARQEDADQTSAQVVVKEGDQYIGTFSPDDETLTPFLRKLVAQAVTDGQASEKDAEGCEVTAISI